MVVLAGFPHSDTKEEADGLAAKIRALRIFDDADGRMNEPLGEREILLRQPVHPLRRHESRQPPELHGRRPRRGRIASLRASLRGPRSSARSLRRAHDRRAQRRRAGDGGARGLTPGPRLAAEAPRLYWIALHQYPYP